MFRLSTLVILIRWRSEVPSAARDFFFFFLRNSPAARRRWPSYGVVADRWPRSRRKVMDYRTCARSFDSGAEHVGDLNPLAQCGCRDAARDFSFLPIRRRPGGAGRATGWSPTAGRKAAARVMDYRTCARSRFRLSTLVILIRWRSGVPSAARDFFLFAQLAARPRRATGWSSTAARLAPAR